jgi:hypothetical protein
MKKSTHKNMFIRQNIDKIIQNIYIFNLYDQIQLIKIHNPNKKEHNIRKNNEIPSIKKKYFNLNQLKEITSKTLFIPKIDLS